MLWQGREQNALKADYLFRNLYEPWKPRQRVRKLAKNL